MNLPNELNYNEALPTLPQCQKINMVISPSNGGSIAFAPSSIITFDLPQNGYMVPDSLVIRYKMNIGGGVNANNVGYALCGTPAYTPFLREEIIINSNVVESINQYNQIMNLLTNLKYSVADKYGQSAGLGFSNSERIGTGASPATEKFDGRIYIQTSNAAYNDVVSIAAPLPCLFSHSKKMIPLGLMPSCRINLTLDTISNMFNGGVDAFGTGGLNFTIPTTFSLSNIELTYDCITFSGEVDNLVRQNSKIFIKSQSFSNSSQTLPVVQGSTSLTFNTRLASIKSAFLNMSSNDVTKCTNKSFDSVDITKGNGDCSLSISGINYPQRSLSTLISKASVFQSLRDAVGAIYDVKNTMSISNLEFNYNDSQTTQCEIPGKFIFAFNLEKLHSKSLLTGTSSQSSAINVNMNFGTATSAPATLNLILNYDALLEIDLENRQCSIKQ
jgi:hypothetical protein